MFPLSPSLRIFFIIILATLACSREQTESNPDGLKAPLHLPPTRNHEFISQFKQKLLSKTLDHGGFHSTDLRRDYRSALKLELIRSLRASQGIARTQIYDMLASFLDPGSTHCAGVSCTRVFQMTKDRLDEFLDEALLTVKKNGFLRDAEHAEEYDILVGSLSKQEQAPWQRPTVDGLSYLPNGDIDRTEGVGAFLDLPLEPGSRNLDVGGGAHDANSRYLATRDITNFVYDPYARSPEHNQHILDQIKKNPADSVTSMSILNVIDTADGRQKHIQLCHNSLKRGGRAFFKVWAGNGTGRGEYIEGGYQSHRAAETYMKEVISVFGPEYVTYDRSLDGIIAVKK